jgi:hypothetical protein
MTRPGTVTDCPYCGKKDLGSKYGAHRTRCEVSTAKKARKAADMRRRLEAIQTPGVEQKEEPPAVERLTRVSEVLAACKIESEDLSDWDMESLDLLPNMRDFQPKPHRYYTPWKVFPSTAMPGLEELLLEVTNCITAGFGAGTTVWKGNRQVKFSKQQWVA